MIESRCGIICSECKYKEEMNCKGCTKIDKPFWGDSCPVKSCCEGRGYEHCGECSDFPCDLLNQFAYDEREGDNGKRIETCRNWAKNQEALKRANEVINSRKDYIGGGMEGYVVLSLINEDGYPTSSTVTISKANGVSWMTFIGAIGGNKSRRIAKNNKASVCLASSEYNITLVGTMEIITDLDVKKEHWQNNAYADWQNPQYCILRFNAESYNIYFASDDTEVKGVL